MSRLTILLPLALALLTAGCGGGGAGDGAEDAGTIPGAAEVTIAEEGSSGPGPFQSAEFDPPIAFNVPAGWRVQEEFGIIQAFRGAGEAEALTFESLGQGELEQRVEQMRGTPDIEFDQPQNVEIAGHQGRMFQAEPNVATPIEGSEYFVIGRGPLRVWVLDVDGTLVAIFAELSVLRTEQREADEAEDAFFGEVDQMLSSLEFGAAQG